MSIDKRSGDKQYYYRSVCSGSTIRREYIGNLSDPLIQLIHRADRLRIANQASENQARQTECDRAKDEEQVLKVLTAIANDWRHLSRLITPDAYRGAHTATPDDFQQHLNTIEELMDTRPMKSDLNNLIRWADEGDPAAIASLKQVLASEQRLVGEAVDLVAIARQLVIDAVAEGSRVVKAALEQQIDQQLKNLTRDQAADGLERMLIDIVAVTYLSAMKSSVLNARASPTRKIADYWETRANKSMKRFHTAVKALREYRQEERGEKSPS